MSEVSPEWRQWMVRNLLLGESREALLRALGEAGLCEKDASEALTSVVDSEGFRDAFRALQPQAAVVRLRREHLRLGHEEIPKIMGTNDHVARAIANQQPVVLTHLTDGWKASEWTWASLVERLGAVEVDASAGRNQRERSHVRPLDEVVRLSFAELVERIHNPETGNSLYVTAPNQVVEGPLAPLLDDVSGIPGVIPGERIADETGCWIGGEGAHTPLHHDTSDILLVPFLGRKRVRMLPPEELEVTLACESFWADEAETTDAMAWRQTTLQPGETLLVPAGWWHAVWCEDPSITLTFAGLAHANSFAWYKP